MRSSKKFVSEKKGLRGRYLHFIVEMGIYTQFGVYSISSTLTLLPVLSRDVVGSLAFYQSK